MTDADRNPNGRFLPGRSGNPAGRELGSRNKATVAMEGRVGSRSEPGWVKRPGLAAATHQDTARIIFPSSGGGPSIRSARQ